MPLPPLRGGRGKRRSPARPDASGSLNAQAIPSLGHCPLISWPSPCRHNSSRLPLAQDDQIQHLSSPCRSILSASAPRAHSTGRRTPAHWHLPLRFSALRLPRCRHHLAPSHLAPPPPCGRGARKRGASFAARGPDEHVPPVTVPLSDGARDARRRAADHKFVLDQT
jgi:hypothetical protein